MHFWDSKHFKSNMKALSLCLFVVLIGCERQDSGLLNHPVKVHLAGAEFARLQTAVDRVLGDLGAKDIAKVGDSVVTAQVTLTAPSATFGVEVVMRKVVDGVWYKVSSANWNDSLAKPANQKIADNIADKTGYVIPKDSTNK